MRKNKIIGLMRKQIPLLFLITVSNLLFIGCNNGGSENKSELADTTKVLVGDSAEVAGEQTDLNSLLMTADDQVRIFNQSNDVKQIYFQFKFVRGKGMTLIATGVDKKGNVIAGSNPIELQIIPKTRINLPQNGLFTTQIVTRGNVKELYGLPSLGKDEVIDDTVFRNIRFTPLPVLGGGNAVFYAITIDPQTATEPYKMNMTGQILTNPSPPAKPCEESCDADN